MVVNFTKTCFEFEAALKPIGYYSNKTSQMTLHEYLTFSEDYFQLTELLKSF